MDYNFLHLHQKASNKGLCGLSEAFEYPSEKRPPDHRQIVYPVYPQVYVLPLMGGYESTKKTIARKRDTQKTLDRKKSNKKLFRSSESFECPSEKRPPDQRRIVYSVYLQVYVLHLIGGYESTEKKIARKRDTQKTLGRKKSNKKLYGLCGSSEAFECPSEKKTPIRGESYTPYTPKYAFYLL